ncbi:Sec-independent protein translocase protein TatB [Vreelandella salicampi]|uniref:Sec-independent protein translocase protein TatB n=1 Tax=Vreelandella salicampi TaxID=1449798 RepID=A0A7Z0LJ70_9GAMM|nr:Sec-independent protein translocase protein TatB [Halomonas salicampi]NYS59893.1 twin-arginine translocase subunit TatB [Halomonas salicampi]
MLDIGFLELLIIAVVGLLVLGPERLPRAARTAGLWVGKIKRTVSGMQREISSQLEAEELRQKLNDQQKSLDDSLKKAKQDVESLAEAPPASQKEEKNLADATARLDDALNTVREDAPSETPKAPSSGQQDGGQQDSSQKAQSQKDEEQR